MPKKPTHSRVLDNFNLPSPIPSSPNSPSQHLSTRSPLPSSSSSPFIFPLTPDAGQITVPILSSIRAFTTIAAALDIMAHVWDPYYLHTLPPTPTPNLPPNLHPTSAQIAIPHHPILDALPWPCVREKLIVILSLPSVCRPTLLQDEGEDEEQGKAVCGLRRTWSITKMECGCMGI